MLFADLTGSTRLSALVRAEPERYAALTRNLLHIYRTVVARHGGIAVRIHGDGVLAMA
jgi:class 3 adenylate cyclase